MGLRFGRAWRNTAKSRPLLAARPIYD